MKTYLVVNPRSANGQTGKRWAELSARIQRKLGAVGQGFTERPDDATRLARRALEEGYECIVAVGGDGTLNEVVNGFFAEGAVINPRAALGLIPRGTGGDFRRTFAWELDLESALARLDGENSQPLDVGQVSFVSREGRPAQRYFANIASFGVSSKVAEEVNLSSKALGGKVSFMLGTVKGLLKYREQKVQLAFDEGPFQDFEVTAVAAANGRYFGGGMCVAPDASSQDGLLDVTVWSGYGLKDFVLKSKGVYSGQHVNWKGTRRFQCKKLQAKAEQPLLLEVDGEVPGSLPCTVSLLPAALRLKA